MVDKPEHTLNFKLVTNFTTPYFTIFKGIFIPYSILSLVTKK
jgi:hypothetical protein